MPPSGTSTEQEAAASLRFLRMLLLLCVLVPAILFVGFAANRWNQLHEEAEIRLDRALRIANEHALKVLESNDAMLGHVIDLARDGQDLAVRANEQALHAKLQQLADQKPQVQSIWVMDADGLTVASSRMSPAPMLMLPDLEFFRWHRANPSGKTYLSELAVGLVTRERYFSTSRARPSRGGAFGGVVVVSLNPDYFTRFHADLSANEPGLAITMFREDGVVYSRWPALPTASPRMSENSAVLQRVKAGSEKGIVRAVSSLDRNARLITYQRVGNYPVYLGTGLEVHAIRQAWLKEMGLLFTFSAIPVLGLIIAAFAAMKRARQALVAATRLREEADARLQVEEALRQAQKMEALGRLTGGVAHDFNNALMVIGANLHMLKITQPRVVGKQTDAIARAVDTAANLTRQLLAFSRRQPLMPQVVSLQQRLLQMKDLLGPVLGSQVSLSIEVDPRTGPVKVDVAELELALINLAVNAKDAMPGNGSFTVRASPCELPQPLHGEGVMIEARDSGSGIPPELLQRVFEPFFTTKPLGEGTGLGLSQVYGLCERSGGTARISSAPGEGTTVTLYLPVTAERAAVDEGEGDSLPARLDLRVLLVEDNDDVAAAIRPVLEMLGCDVRRFARAAEALQWLQLNAAQCDVVLTDVVMPGDFDGLAFAEQVRSLFPALRLVVMTGYAEQMDHITRQGFTLLAKPWTPHHLARALGGSRSH